jgi:hypothetical protein
MVPISGDHSEKFVRMLLGTEITFKFSLPLAFSTCVPPQGHHPPATDTKRTVDAAPSASMSGKCDRSQSPPHRVRASSLFKYWIEDDRAVVGQVSSFMEAFKSVGRDSKASGLSLPSYSTKGPSSGCA